MARTATHCTNGHAWTPDNTIVRKNGYTECKKCKREAVKSARIREACKTATGSSIKRLSMKHCGIDPNYRYADVLLRIAEVKACKQTT